MRGGGRDGLVAWPLWCRRGRAGRSAVCRRGSWPGCARGWRQARPRMGGPTSGGHWSGSPRWSAGCSRCGTRCGDFDIDHLAAIIKTRLRSIQHRPWLFAGFLAQTGLTLDPQPPW